ncbi:MAG: hypothetical protein LUF30_05580 [Lachnospiraceae bacterium]|nr:hypothetical protein [Lachnospiraceae bacterium]
MDFENTPFRQDLKAERTISQRMTDSWVDAEHERQRSLAVDKMEGCVGSDKLPEADDMDEISPDELPETDGMDEISPDELTEADGMEGISLDDPIRIYLS